MCIRDRTTALKYNAQPWTAPCYKPAHDDDDQQRLRSKGVSRKRWLAMISVGCRINTPWESRKPVVHWSISTLHVPLHWPMWSMVVSDPPKCPLAVLANKTVEDRSDAWQPYRVT
eukprot:4191939-Pyramimonas_sp.AAC.1